LARVDYRERSIRLGSCRGFIMIAAPKLFKFSAHAQRRVLVRDCRIKCGMGERWPNCDDVAATEVPLGPEGREAAILVVRLA